MSEHITDERGEVHGDIVRCRDCKHYDPKWKHDTYDAYWCHEWVMYTDADGYCHKGERNDRETVEVWQPASPEDVTRHFLTCKCGEELETEGKCPSCGRWVHD